MAITLPTPTPKLKRAGEGSPAKANVLPAGRINSSRGVHKHISKGKQVTVSEGNHAKVLAADSVEHTAVAGMSMGITIPGPDGSYMSARIDVYGHVPTLPSDAGMRAGYDRISKLVQERLEVEVTEAKEALGLV